ncbi:MAG TPA: MarR family transcriptional regulator [Candidatus Limnocylindria bacterium]|nr:MarR family transcriptional regulator [Candidatus Limnocylindria bacterium]
MTKLGRWPGSAVIGLRILNHVVGQQLSAAIEPQDLTLPQLGILHDVKRIPGVSSAGLARVRSFTPQTMSEVITGLERDGLIERRAQGGRILRMYLTPRGAERLAKAGAAAAAVERKMLEALSPKDQEKFRELIYACVAHLTEGEEERAS